MDSPPTEERIDRVPAELSDVEHPPRSVRWGPWRIQPPTGTESRRLKLLLLHGFAGAPGELRPLGQALARRGFSATAPLLPGHGENLEAMAGVLLQDWVEAVCLCYESLRRDGSPVAMVGFCLGGALALRLAGRLRPRAVCCLATPAQPLPDSAYPPVAGFRSTLMSLNNSPSREVQRWRLRGCHKLVPETFFAQYQTLLSQLQAALAELRCPVLVAQSRGDQVTPPGDAQAIVDALAGQRRTLVWSRRAGHALPLDQGRRALFAQVGEFLQDQDQDLFKA